MLDAYKAQLFRKSQERILVKKIEEQLKIKFLGVKTTPVDHPEF